MKCLERNCLHLSRNTKEWYESAVDILAGNLVTTNRIFYFFYGTSHLYELHRNQMPKYTLHTNLEKSKYKLHTMRLDVHDLSGYQRCGDKQLQIVEAQDYAGEHCMR
jgi:hypothetical protein